MASPRSQCPSCGSPRVEPFMDYRGHHVDYFRCADCRHVWNVPKGQDAPVNHVTPLPPGRPMKMAASETLQDLRARAERAVQASRRLGAEYLVLESEAIELARRATDSVAALARLCPRWGRRARIASAA